MTGKSWTLMWALGVAVSLGACNPTTNTEDAQVGTDAARESGVDASTADRAVADAPASETVIPDDVVTATCGSAVGTCNPVTNAGCTTGNGCYIFNSGDAMHPMLTAGCQARGTGGYGQSCASSNDCLEGFSCLNSTCTRLCCGAGDDNTCRTGAGGMLNARCTGGQITGTDVSTCVLTQRCDWFSQNCASGNCIPVDTAGTTMCQPAGAVAVGGDCTADPTSCARGEVCIQRRTDGGAPSSACLKICNPMLAAGSDAGAVPDGGIDMGCPAMNNCGGVTDTPRTFGVCLPPGW